MHPAPVISISLPTRNRLKSVQVTIARIIDQTFTDWELVITDNASDEPGKIDYLKKLSESDPRVKLHLQPVNIGLLPNWIFGINQSSGRYYIATTDDDTWGETDYLEKLLEMHDGKTGVVFPNISIDYPESGEFRDKVLTHVYDNEMSRYEMCHRMVIDRQGIIMMGLFDLGVIPKHDIISVYDHGRHSHCEGVGMIRMVRDYPVKFCPSVSYVHTSYSDNYSLNCLKEVVMRDSGIGTFQLLDELRLAAKKDPGYEPALQSQWQLAFHYCHGLSKNYELKDGVIKPRQPKVKGPIRRFFSSKRKALKKFIAGKSRTASAK